MDSQAQIILRAKKLGTLLRDARLATRRSIKECAKAIDVTTGVFKAYEEGRKSPSLPELEALVYYFDLPIDQFWSNEALSDNPARIDELNLSRLTELRHRMIGAFLRQERMNASLSMKSVAEQTGISTGRLKRYELGERPIPLPELEVFLKVPGRDKAGLSVGRQKSEVREAYPEIVGQLFVGLATGRLAHPDRRRSLCVRPKP